VQYPTLARIARDYLAVQGSSVPSERVFSSGGLTGTRLRGRLSPQIFEALQILKSGYRNGHIGAEEQAEQHFKDIMEVVNCLEDEDEV
jgi:hAT family C-terminal dimerisation region